MSINVFALSEAWLVLIDEVYRHFSSGAEMVC